MQRDDLETIFGRLVATCEGSARGELANLLLQISHDLNNPLSTIGMDAFSLREMTKGLGAQLPGGAERPVELEALTANLEAAAAQAADLASRLADLALRLQADDVAAP